VVVNFHGYPSAVKQLLYGRNAIAGEIRETGQDPEVIRDWKWTR
jgi:hypothetical protein